jgi:hypothetical protein
MFISENNLLSRTDANDTREWRTLENGMRDTREIGTRDTQE